MKRLLESCRGWYRSSRGRLSCAGVAAVCTLTLYACGGSDDAPPLPVDDPGPVVTLGVERVFPNLTFANPVAMLQAPNDSTRWFVVEQGGVVRVFDNIPTATALGTFINLTDRVDAGGEMGLLGMAFHPNFPSDPRIFVHYTNLDSGRVSRISEFKSSDGGATLDADPERILLVINQPEANHNGGHLAFGLDGFLYIGVGDGGGSNDGFLGTAHGPIGNAQNMMTLLGKMLRIDVSPATSYAIPSGPNGNLFAGNALCGGNGTGAQPCPEIYASGFRNPWRWSFDRQMGQLWVGDVGQETFEEIDRVVAGGNYGWRCFEGTMGPVNQPCGMETNLLPPIAEYGHTVGQSVTGGYVYRGSAIAGLNGRYVFGDFITKRIWNIAGNTAPTRQVTGGFASGLSISSFGEDVDGELYVVHYHATNGALYRLTAP